MSPSLKTSLVISASLGATIAALGAQPPDVVNSDANRNTAMGYSALRDLSTGANNTAAGYTALLYDTVGANNTAFGASALFVNTTGSGNTALGWESLGSNRTGSLNTGAGVHALTNNTTGVNGTALGAYSLNFNTTGENNTGIGTYSMSYTSIGSDNTGLGAFSLYSNVNGNNNTASGYESLTSNVSGSNNTAFGYSSLLANETGYDNTAGGSFAMQSNYSGYENAAFGYESLEGNSTGHKNAGFGEQSLFKNISGSHNIGVGYQAGYNVTASNNIDIGNAGTAADNGTIRIGESGTHNAAFIAGIGTTHLTGAAVYVDSHGQLGVLASSERYKTAIAPMTSTSERLDKLRPVTFHLKSEPHGELQYGLIAEEVDRVFPELVIRNDTGRIEGVRYDELAPILLNEVQRQRQQLALLEQQAGDMQAELKKLRAGR